MAQAFPGSLRLFRAAGVDVFLHWSWFVVAFLEVQFRERAYRHSLFNAVEYLALFVLVLLHEFGHALACRQVGGRADRILLWPLGGVAFVQPPPRPGAVLWSIAAGPLVNVALLLPTVGLFTAGVLLGWKEAYPDAYALLRAVTWINVFLLLLNLLPVYPLDGGQILFAALWFVVGRVNALLAVSVLGLLGAVGMGLIALPLIVMGSAAGVWFAVLAVFVGLRAAAGLGQARALARALAAPRHRDFACPACGTAPPAGELWGCDQCGARFDTFANRASCPNCGQRFPETACPECHRRSPLGQWYRGGYGPPVAAGQTGPAPDAGPPGGRPA